MTANFVLSEELVLDSGAVSTRRLLEETKKEVAELRGCGSWRFVLLIRHRPLGNPQMEVVPHFQGCLLAGVLSHQHNGGGRNCRCLPN